MQSFKFRHVNKISGAFISVTLVIIIALVSLAGRAQQWFIASTEYRVMFEKADGTMGIQKGSDVRVFGNHVGHVQSVDLVNARDLSPVDSFEGVSPDDLVIVAVLSVKGEFTNFIGADSKAVLKYDLGGLGSAYFDISRGSLRRDHGSTDNLLKIEIAEDMTKKMEGMLTEFQQTALTTLESITATSEETQSFIAKLANDKGDLFVSVGQLQSTLENIDTIIGDIENGEGAIGLLLRDVETEDRVSKLVSSLSPTIENLNAAIAHLDEGITEIRTGISSFNDASSMLVDTVGTTDETIAGFGAASDQLSEMLRESEILVEGLQRHWIVRHYVDDPIEDAEGNPLTTAAELAGGNPPSARSASGSERPPPSPKKNRTSHRLIGRKR